MRAAAARATRPRARRAPLGEYDSAACARRGGEEEHVGSPIFRCRRGSSQILPSSPHPVQLPCRRVEVACEADAADSRRAGCSLLALGALVALLIGFMRVVWRLAHLETRHRWAPVPPAPDMAGGPAIPKVIHQMYQSEQLPAQWRNGSAAWKQLHPDYRYVLWTDASLRELIAAEYPQMLALYDGHHATQRWDASRYAILHHHGGLYADLDLRPVRRRRPAPRPARAVAAHAEHRADERANGVDACHPFSASCSASCQPMRARRSGSASTRRC